MAIVTVCDLSTCRKELAPREGIIVKTLDFAGTEAGTTTWNMAIGTGNSYIAGALSLGAASAPTATSLTLADAWNIVVGSGTGTKIGTATTQLLGFYNATPVAQRSGSAQAAVVTTGSTLTTPYGYTTSAQADGIVTLLNELRAWAVAQGFIKGSA